MFIYNVNLSKTKLFKIILIIVIVLLIIFFGISAYRILNPIFSASTAHPNVATITPQNYTNILKAVHEDIDTYVGQSIKFSGYIYRVSDLSQDQFVLARDMVINNEHQTLVVGFLCSYKNAQKWADRTWVELTGTITKGNYHGDMPIIKVEKLYEIGKPLDEFVCMPDDFYIPTSALYYDED